MATDDNPTVIDQFMAQIREILESEREVNSQDPLLVSLITRIENRIVEAKAEFEEK